jgi:hypothetical protein
MDVFMRDVRDLRWSGTGAKLFVVVREASLLEPPALEDLRRSKTALDTVWAFWASEENAAEGKT